MAFSSHQVIGTASLARWTTDDDLASASDLDSVTPNVDLFASTFIVPITPINNVNHVNDSSINLPFLKINEIITLIYNLNYYTNTSSTICCYAQRFFVNLRWIHATSALMHL